MKTNNANRRKFLKTAGIGSLAAVGSVSSQAISVPAILSGKKRIIVGTFSDETNTFIPRSRILEETKRLTDAEALCFPETLYKNVRMAHV